LGFAIPINQARKTADQLIKNGKATYPVMGISVDMNFSGEGALIAKNAKAILAGGPAAKAGMKAGDIITSIDGRAITSPEELIVAIRARNVGDSIEVTFKRGTDVKTVTMTLTAAK
jgi:putative serine protease PepD